MIRDRGAGMILVNVLVVLGLAAAVVQIMLTLADLAIARSQGFGDAGEALALVRGAEQFAIAALRRDMIEAPETDSAAEPWGRLAGEDIPGGTLAFRIEDAQGLLNLNALAESDGARRDQVVRALGAAAGLPPEAGSRILSALASGRPLRRIEELTARAGLAPEEVARLRRLASALPGEGLVNVNAASVELLALLLGDADRARRLVDIRDRDGVLTPDGVAAAGIVLPPEFGYGSDLYRLRTTAHVGDVALSFESLLMRREGPAGPEVLTIGRSAAAPAVPPPPPPRTEGPP